MQRKAYKKPKLEKAAALALISGAEPSCPSGYVYVDVDGCVIPK